MKKLILCILLLSGVPALAQTDTAFWFAAPEVSQNGSDNLDRPITIRMTAGAQPATVTISQPAGGGLPPQTVNIPAGSTQSVDLTTWLGSIENDPPNTVLNYGLKVKSNTPITAYYEVISGLNVACQCNPEIFTLKGKNALGTDFWIPSQNFVENSSSYTPLPFSKFDIIATQNNTTVTITPSNDVVGHLAGIPYTITLNEGQTYSARAVSQAAALHLQGSRVTADKPVAITATDDLISAIGVWGTHCIDLVGDQIVPLNIVGTEYIAVAGNLAAPYDQLFILGTQNGTTINQNWSPAGTVGTGQTLQLAFAGDATYIQTSQPVYLIQLTGIGCELGSALLPQINCTGSSSVSFTRSSSGDLYINLLVKAGGQGGFLVNGAAGVVTAAQFAAVPGTASQWFAAKVLLPLATYPQNSVIKVTNGTHLFHLGMLDGSVTGGARFGYFSNYGGIDPQIGLVSPACIGSPLALTTDTVMGGTYSWTGPNGFTSNLQNPVITASATASHSGTYTVTVTAGTCSGSGSVNITVNPLPTVTVTHDVDTICASGSTVLTATGAATYTWAPATGLSSTTGTSVVASPTVATSYVVTGTDTAGCTGRDTARIGIGSSITRSYAVSACSDTTFQFGAQTIQSSGVYTETFTTASGCDSVVTLTVTLSPPPVAGFTFSPDPPAANNPLKFKNTSFGASSYLWQFGDGQTSTDVHPSHLYQATGSYIICLTARSAQGCIDTACRTIFADVRPVADVPKAFSPNGDGRNDILFVRGTGVAAMSLKIYNRWGQMIFESNSITQGWDGKVNGVRQEMDAYAYVLQVTFNNGTSFTKKGNVTLIR